MKEFSLELRKAESLAFLARYPFVPDALGGGQVHFSEDTKVILSRGAQSLNLDIDELGALKQLFRSSDREMKEKMRLLVEEGFIDFSSVLEGVVPSNLKPTLDSYLHLPSSFNYCQDIFIPNEFLLKAYQLWEQGKGLIQLNAMDATRKGLPFPRQEVLKKLQSFYASVNLAPPQWKGSGGDTLVTLMSKENAFEEIFFRELPARRKGWERDVCPKRKKKSNVAEIEHLGHAGLAFSNGEFTLLFDPVFFSPNPRMVVDPYTPEDWEKIDAVFFTHFHGDHFDFGSLLQIPFDTPIFVPKCTGNPFDPPMRKFLSQMGFSNVQEWEAGNSMVFGPDLKVNALPFVGEASDVLGFSGLLYGLEHKGKSALFLADGSSSSKGRKIWDSPIFQNFVNGRRIDYLFSTWWQQKNFVYELSPYIPFMPWIDPEEWLNSNECCDMGSGDLLELAKRIRPRETLFYAEGGHSLFERDPLAFRIELPFTWRDSSTVALALEREGFRVRQAYPRMSFNF